MPLPLAGKDDKDKERSDFSHALTCFFLTSEELVLGLQELLKHLKPCTAPMMAERCRMLPAQQCAQSGIPLKAASLKRGKAVSPKCCKALERIMAFQCLTPSS
jgi:hypothetical protein